MSDTNLIKEDDSHRVEINSTKQLDDNNIILKRTQQRPKPFVRKQFVPPPPSSIVSSDDGNLLNEISKNPHYESDVESEVDYRQQYNEPIRTPPRSDNYEIPHMSDEQRNIRKAQLLWRYNKVNKDKRYSHHSFDMNSDESIIESECIRIEKQKEIEGGLEMLKSSYQHIINLTEFASKYQKIVALDLNGWGQKVCIDMEGGSSYDDVFEDIYKQYFSGAKMNPFLTLLMMTVQSGTMIHLSNKYLNKDSMSMFSNILNAANNVSNTNEETFNGPSDDYASIIEKMKANKSVTPIDDDTRSVKSSSSSSSSSSISSSSSSISSVSVKEETVKPKRKYVRKVKPVV